jgi:peptide/nickel transport system substrate-binding protein
MSTKRVFFYVLIYCVVFAITISACQPAATPTVVEATKEEVTSPAEKPTEVPPAMTEKPVESTEAPVKTEETTGQPVLNGVDATPLYGGTLVVPRWPDFPTCNPAISTDLTISMMGGNVFSALVRQNIDLEPQPELAKSWDISEDGLTLTFYLRDDVKWHDGVPFTSADVKFTYGEALSVLHPRGKAVFNAIESIETPDDYTVIFHMSEPKPAFMYQANAPESMIIPKHIYENEDLVEGPHATCQELPIGTGAFKAEEYVPGDHFTMVRNDEWWGTKGNYWGRGQPFLDKVILAFVPDNVARINGFESGEFDYLSLLMMPRNEYKRFGEMEGRTVSLEGMSMIGVQSFFGFNLRREPVNDLCVRQAIAYAMDLEAINEKVLYGTGFPTMTFLPPNHPEFNDNLLPWKYQPQDIEKANAMLDDCGYPRGSDGSRFELKLSYDTRPERVDMAEIFQQLVEPLGIRLEMAGVDYSIWVDETYIQHDYDITVATLGVGEPSVGAARLLVSTNIGESNFNNSSAYANPEMDELWETYSTSFDPKVRKDAIDRIQEIILEDLPYLYVNASVYPNAWNSAEFAGFHVDSGSGSSLLRNVWWLEGRPEP